MGIGEIEFTNILFLALNLGHKLENRSRKNYLAAEFAAIVVVDVHLLVH